MKKIINGLRYDSEKAVCVGSDSYSNPSDFHYWEETLYKTPRSGRFFVVGEGGPMSRYAETIGQNQWSGGSDLRVLDKTEALRWCEEHLGAGEWEENFADSIEDA